MPNLRERTTDRLNNTPRKLEIRAANQDMERLRAQARQTCLECGRIFNLWAEVDAQEWAYGHDCEVT
jgi:hypothetical protein